MPPPGVTGVWADEPFKLIPTPGLTEPVGTPESPILDPMKIAKQRLYSGIIAFRSSRLRCISYGKRS
jgi:hypothetical protein